MTATPVADPRPARVATSGSTTRRAGLWQSPVVRRGATDLIALLLLLATGVQAFGPVFGGYVGYAAAGAGVVLGLGVAVASAWRGWSKLGTLVAGMLVYLAVGGPVALPDTTIAGLVPTPETIQRLTLLSWQSWRDLLTVPLPAGDFDGPAVLPFLAALTFSTLAASAVLRLRRLGATIVLALLPSAGFLLVGILWGSHDAPVAALQGAVFVVVALAWTSWRSQLGQIDTHVVFLRSATGVRGPRTHQVATAGLALALAAGLGAGAWVVLGAPDRHVLRDDVDPPLDVEQYPSPLTMYRHLESDLDDKVLFTVTGLPDGARIRLAAMDLYDGNVYNVTDSSAQFARVGSTVEPSQYSDPDADLARLTFHIDSYRGVWLPGGGDLRALDASADLGNLYYNDATGTVLATSGVSQGSHYTLDVGLAPTYTERELADLPSDAQPDFGFRMASNTATVAAVSATRPDLQGDATTPMGQLRKIAEALRTGGFFADGDPDPSFAGHTSERIRRLLADESGTMVGDDEQYAVAMTLMARDLGLPARVVMGFYPDPKTTPDPDGVAITGDDAHVWVEVLFKQLGWVPFDPTPDDDNRPNVQEQQPEKRHDPQVLPPPDVPDDHEPKAPPPADSDVDKNEQKAGSVWHLLKVAAIAIGTAAVLVGPFFLIAALKARRRRRRRSSGRLADRISGGWAEVMDLATDLGIRVPEPATRFEAAVLMEDRVPPTSTIPIAHRVDAHVFGAGEPTEVDVEAVWTAVEGLRSDFRQSASLRDRIRQRFSLRSLVRRPAWLARAELRAASGSGR